MQEILKDDYNIATIKCVKPYADSFDLCVTNRFVSTYSLGYEQLSTRLAKQLCCNIDIFVDVGAHYGYYSLLAATSNKNLRIISFEPVAANFAILKDNFLRNKVDPSRYECINAAVSDQKGMIDFYISEASDNCSIYPHPSSKTLAKVVVEKMSLDDVIPRITPQTVLIKTDTDGHELEVLGGLEATLKFHHDVMILMEINPKMLKIAGGSSEKIFYWMESHGYCVYAIDDTDGCFYPIKTKIDFQLRDSAHSKTYYNVICIKKEKTASLVFFSHTSNLDGAGRSLCDLAAGLTAQGAICNIVLPADGDLKKLLQSFGCGVHVVLSDLSRIWQWVGLDKNHNTFCHAQGLENLKSNLLPTIKKFYPAYIISQTITVPWGAISAEIIGVPHAISAREYGQYDHGLSFNYGFRESINSLYSSSDAVFCISRDVCGELFGADEDFKCEVIYSEIKLDGIPDKYPKVNSVDALFEDSKGLIFCMPASFHPGKGQEDLVNAVIELRSRGASVRCLLVGLVSDVTYFEKLCKIIECSGFSSSFALIDFISDIYVLLRQVDCVVSCSRREALGRTIIEASLLEKPVIFTNSGGFREVYQAGIHGLSYEPGNILQLSACIENILENFSEAMERAKVAKVFCEHLFSAGSYSGAVFKKIKLNLSLSLERKSSELPVLELIQGKNINLSNECAWQPKFYYGELENDFSERRVKFSEPIKFGFFESMINIENNRCKAIRFDPIENFFVSIQNLLIDAFDIDGVPFESSEIHIATNAIDSSLSMHFLNLDPQIKIIFPRPVLRIRVLGEIICISKDALVNNIIKLNQSLAARDSEKNNLTQVVSVSAEEIASLTQVVSVSAEEIASLTQVVSVSAEEIASLTQVVSVSAKEIACLTQTMSLQEEHIASLRTQLNGVLGSKSWLLTAPFRNIRRKLRLRPSTLRKKLSDCAHRVWRGIPLSIHGKQKVKNVIFSTLSPLFRHTQAYRTWKDSRQFVHGYSGLNSVQDTKLLCESENQYVPILDSSPLESKPVKLICFYLPQFHSIPENDAWWGEGFTEWTNVQPAQPQFVGHYQPHVPGELGYYNLLDSNVQQRQVELAKLYGIEGFCFYFYWFDGKRLLEDPLQNYLKDTKLDLPFCLCWANENWCRRWDGLDNEILIAQKHSEADDLAFIQYVAQYMRDPRYIRIDGKPLLLIYRPSLLPSAQDTSRRWRKWCFENGIGEVYLAYTQSFEAIDPADYGFDAAIEFPPNNSAPPVITDHVSALGEDFEGTVYDWNVFVERSDRFGQPDYKLFRSVCPSWDNTPRRKNSGTIFLNTTPRAYQRWLENAIAETKREHSNPQERLIFVNAWNEWAEGAHLEPDTRYGYAWLQATRNALSGETFVPDNRRKIVLVAHDAYPHGAQLLALNFAITLSQGMRFHVDLVCLGDGPLKAEYSKYATLHDLTGLNPRGSEAVALAKRLYASGHRAALVNTTVSGFFLETLSQQGFCCIALIHELRGVLEQNKLHEQAKAIATYAQKIVFPAEEVASAFAEVAHVLPEKVIIRPQGLYKRRKKTADRAGDRSALRQSLDLPLDCQIILGVGYADHRKGIDLFVDAGLKMASRHPNARWVWIGHWDSGMQKTVDKLLAKHEALKEMFIFPGLQSDTDMYYGGADIFALTSREDPFPSVVLEALDASLPVVAFEGAGGFVRLLAEGSGKLVPKEDSGAFADAVADLLESSANRNFLGQQGLVQISERFSFRHYVFDLLRFLGIDLLRISAIVPNYNYARYLPERLGSILGQDYPIYEVIFLDDCSTDNSVDVAREILESSEIDFKIVVNDENSGSVFRQWKKGVEMAVGSHIWLAEADDSCEIFMLGELAGAYKTPGVVLSYCESQQIDETGAKMADNYLAYVSDIDAKHWLTHFVAEGQSEIVNSLSIKNAIPNVSAVLFNSKSIKSVLINNFDLISSFKIAGDWFIYALVLHEGRVAFSPLSYNKHRRHKSGMTISNINLGQLKEISKMQEYIAFKYGASVDQIKKSKQYIYDLQVEHGIKAE